MNQLKKTETSGGTLSTSSRLTLKKEKCPGLCVTSVEGLAHKEFHLTLQPLPGEEPAGMIRRLATVLGEKNATVVRHEIFGSNAAHKEAMRALQQEVRNFDWPVTWIGGGKDTDNAISGMHVFAVAGTRVRTICTDGQPVGRVFNDGQIRHCLLAGMKPTNLSASKPAQCQEIFQNLESALREADMSMASVVRTWFFLDDILSWYGEFNNARIEFFKERKLLDGLLPASTGVGGRNLEGVAIVGGACAVQAMNSSVAVHAVPSPLQCSSMEYGSAFSRAVLVDTPSCRRLLVSGTASIGPDGRSLHAGDLRQQIALTMEVAREILASRGFSFSDVTRATAYFKNLQDAPAFDLWRKRQGLEPFPLIATQSTICRRELLFEIELDAISLEKVD